MENTIIQLIDKEVFFYLLDKKLNNTKIQEHKIENLVFLTFDDDIGQVIEKLYPENSLDQQSSKQISSTGFPETNSCKENGEITYIFNYRENIQQSLNNVSLDSQIFKYCYAKFLQKKNINAKRGYSQKSIVITSHIYNPKIFIPFLNELVELYINNNYIPLSNDNCKEFLNKCNDNINKEEIEENIFFDDMSYVSISKFQINSFFENLTFYYTNKIISLWELVITEVPIIVFADDPKKCSNVVKLLESLIFPFEFKGDVRPYFSIYDYDFKAYKDDKNLSKLNSPILGVINPFCANCFEDYVILHFDDNYYNEKLLDNPTKDIKYKTYEELVHSDSNFIIKQKKEPNINNVSKIKILTKPDKNLIKTFYQFLSENNNNDFSRLNNYLRMYLIEINNDFARNIEEYLFKYNHDEIKKLAFIKNNFSMFEIFNENKFFKYLHKNEKNIFNKKYVFDIKKTCALYQKFFKTKCFHSYLEKFLPKIKNL
jgi:hypothetical protein